MIDIKEEQRTVRDFLGHIDKLRQAISDSDDNKAVDASLLDGARLWHRLTEREKKLAFAMTKDKSLYKVFINFDKYPLQMYEEILPGMYKYNTFEEWKAAQEENRCS
jgi:hypothetical protein